MKAQGEIIGVLCQGLDEQWVILLTMRHGRDHLIEIEDDLEEEGSEEEDDGRAPVQVPPPVVSWLVPIEDDEVDETDSEIEEELAIEITTIDPAPAYTK